MQALLDVLQQSPDPPPMDTLACILEQCRKEKNLTCYWRCHALVHGHGLEAHSLLGNRLVPMLVECGDASLAEQVFYRLIHKTEGSWTSLIQAYAESERSQHALTLFENMQECCVYPSSYTFVALLKACSCLVALQNVHVQIAKESFDEDPYVVSALVDAYCQAGLLVEAQATFDNQLVRDVVLWTSLAVEYLRRGFPGEALDCLLEMQANGVHMDAVAYVCALKACGSIADIFKGHVLHAEIIQYGLESEPFVANSVAGMYAKCGLFLETAKILDEHLARDVVAWNVLISGYSKYGLDSEVFGCLERMKMEGISPNNLTFVCALQTFQGDGDAEKVQQIHLEISKQGLEADLSIGNALVDAYCKCGLANDAYEIFRKLTVQDAVSWTLLLGGFIDCGLCEEVLDCLECIKHSDVSLDTITLVCVLKACSSIGALDEGRGYHVDIVKLGFEKESFVGNTLIDMYAKCTALADAQHVFNNMQVHSVVSWNALLGGYIEHELAKEVIDCFQGLHLEGLSPNIVTYVLCLRGCVNIPALGYCQELHHQVTKSGLESSILIGASLIGFYAKSGAFLEARKVFDGLQEQNVVTWAAFLAGYIDHGFFEEALMFLLEMRQTGVFPNAILYAYAVKACSKLGSVDKCAKTHTEIVCTGWDMDEGVCISLINMYARIGLNEEAEDLHADVPTRNIRSWTTLMMGYFESGQNDRVLECFVEMEYEGVCSDVTAYICTLKACGNIDIVNFGLLLHTMAVDDGMESHASIADSLLYMYTKYGLFQEVEKLFCNLQTQSTETWNVLLTGYDEHGLNEDVLRYFEKMQQCGVSPNNITYACVLRACCRATFVDSGQSVHAHIVLDGYERDPCVVFALIHFYLNCRFFEEVRSIFNEQSIYDITLWNTLLTSYVKHGLGEDVLNTLDEMTCEGVLPDVVTFICSLKACSMVGAINRGRETHANIVKEELERENILGNTLVDMYAKCGFIAEAHTVFSDLVIRDVISWNALISGYACQGHYAVVFNLLQEMMEEGVQPDEIVYLRLLSICSHAGFVSEGYHYFMYVSGTCITMTIEHCNCMIDLLSRAGQLDEAIAMLEKMPCLPDHVTWTIVLGACQKWGNLDLGRQAFDGAMMVDVERAASFVLMSNICARDFSLEI